MKNYTQSPLPFMGQKRCFVKAYREVLQQCDDDITIVDLFGGSGLLSQVSKQEKPNARVIYNDYDGYRDRLRHVDQTNKLIADIRVIASGVEKSKRFDKDRKQKIIERIEHEEGYVDYITLSSSILFSSKYVTSLEELKKENLYNNVTMHDYNADGYLDGVEVVCDDYKRIFDSTKDIPNVLFLVDPPYLCTQVDTYKMSWRLSDYLDVLTILDGHKYIYFTSNKSSIIELCDWIGEGRLARNPFCDTHRLEIGKHLNYDSRYVDIMIHNL